jgi:hypothetical protein
MVSNIRVGPGMAIRDHTGWANMTMEETMDDENICVVQKEG